MGAVGWPTGDRNAVAQGIVFICHASKDEDYVGPLLELVKPVIHSTLTDLRLWEDSQIYAGEQWDESVQSAIDQAVAAVVLVSTNLLNASYALEKELPKLLSRALRKELTIMCLYVKPSLADQYVFKVPVGKASQEVALTAFQGLNSPLKPLSTIINRHKREAALEQAGRNMVATLKTLKRPKKRR